MTIFDTFEMKNGKKENKTPTSLAMLPSAFLRGTIQEPLSALP